MKFTLDILIPTYNRAKYLLKNIELLSEIVGELGFENETSVIVSDNASTDDTKTLMNDLLKSGDVRINIKYYRQENSLGMCGNFLFCLREAGADYIMLLGDDDYCSKEYLVESINAIENYGVGCVLPAFRGISETGKLLSIGRDLGCKRHVFKAGIENFLINNTRGHQMSGLILKRSGLYEACVEHKVDNLYIQMYWVAYNCLKYPTIHIPEYPILVTQTNKKAWSYDSIGLLGEIFDNYEALPLTASTRLRAELGIINRQSGRVLHLKNPLRQILAIFKLITHKNTSLLGRFYLPFVILYLYCREMGEVIKYKISAKN